MTPVRRTLGLVAASGLAAVVGVVPAQPALAHGATTQPISRTAACTPGSADSSSAACKAALAANGRPFGTFDNLRVPGVAGRDKQLIPDGNLCSGDLPQFSGLDLARRDWPATRVTAGQKINIRYATTIPHKGKFRVYLTKPGYDPGKRLGWDDLSAKPIITASDLPVRNGAYRFSGKLPADRSGRHVLYVVWETTSTPDTYYSCSDLIIKAAAVAVAPPKTNPSKSKPAASRSPEPEPEPEPDAVAVAQPVQAAGPPSRAAAPAAEESWILRAGHRVPVGGQLLSTAAIVLVGVGAAVGLLWVRRRRSAQQIHRRFEKR